MNLVYDGKLKVDDKKEAISRDWQSTFQQGRIKAHKRSDVLAKKLSDYEENFSLGNVKYL